MVEKHKHSCHTVIGGERRCFCGVVLCLSVRPELYEGGNVVCTLEKGHEEPCENTDFPEAETWERPGGNKAKKQPTIILVEGRKPGREVCLACLRGQPATVVSGKTMDEAVGHIIRNHQEELNLKVVRK